LAAGKSSRFGGELPKQFQMVCGKPLLSWSISRFEAANSIDSMIIVGQNSELERIQEEAVDRYDFQKVRKIVAGGESRFESVQRGIAALPSSPGLIAIHDGARPLTKAVDIDRVVAKTAECGAAVLAKRAVDTLKVVKDLKIESTPDRTSFYLAETPQVFRHDLLVEGYKKAINCSSSTDDASLVEQLGVTVEVVESTACNIKVTTAEDMMLVELILKKELDE